MAYEMKRIKSKTFNTVDLEFNNECVTHNSLKNFATINGIITQTEAVTVDTDNRYWLFKTKAALKTANGFNYQVEEFGEAQESTLTTEIARNYPAKMATKRAFDAAIISIICPEGQRLYSDSECPNGLNSANTGFETNTTTAEKTQKPAELPYMPSNMATQAGLTGWTQPPAQMQPQSAIMTGTATAYGVSEVQPVQTNNTVSAGEYVINFTEQFRGKTLNQIAAGAGGMDWIKFMASGRYQGFSEAEAALIAEAVPQCKAYIDSVVA